MPFLASYDTIVLWPQVRLSRPKSLEAALNKFDALTGKPAGSPRGSLGRGLGRISDTNPDNAYEREDGRSMTIGQGLPPRAPGERNREAFLGLQGYHHYFRERATVSDYARHHGAS